jgi:hypothetical protein
LVGEWAEGTGAAASARSVFGVLEVGVLNGQAEEVEDALVLGAGSDMLANLSRK